MKLINLKQKQILRSNEQNEYDWKLTQSMTQQLILKCFSFLGPLKKN